MSLLTAASSSTPATAAAAAAVSAVSVSARSRRAHLEHTPSRRTLECEHEIVELSVGIDDVEEVAREHERRAVLESEMSRDLRERGRLIVRGQTLYVEWRLRECIASIIVGHYENNITTTIYEMDLS